jgi:hypothetical protein
MNRALNRAIIDFEIYLLMTMQLRMRMSHKEAHLEAKLAENGFSVDDAARVHARIAEALGEEAVAFESLKNLLDIADPDSVSLEYSSVFWPGFEFKAVAGKDGLLDAARYWHTRHDSYDIDSPTELPIWSMDVTEFTERFGPMRRGRQWPLFDEVLPGYEEYEFPWNGESYGAGFNWGLFMFAAKSWPED